MITSTHQDQVLRDIVEEADQRPMQTNSDIASIKKTKREAREGDRLEDRLATRARWSPSSTCRFQEKGVTMASMTTTYPMGARNESCYDPRSIHHVHTSSCSAYWHDDVVSKCGMCHLSALECHI